MDRPLPKLRAIAPSGSERGDLPELESHLAELERHVHEGARLWEREWAQSALRSLSQALGGHSSPKALALLGKVEQLAERSFSLDRELFQPLQLRLAAGRYSPSDLLTDLDGYLPEERDPFVERVLGVHVRPQRTVRGHVDMMPYVPTSFDAILELVRFVSPSDVFVDIGAGLGKVAMLVRWLSNAKVHAIEIDPAYHRFAKERFDALGFHGIELFEEDARSHDYSAGTVFYLYHPFDGEVLRSVAESLARQARRRSFKLVAKGPCAEIFERAASFRLSSKTSQELSVFESRPELSPAP